MAKITRWGGPSDPAVQAQIRHGVGDVNPEIQQPLPDLVPEAEPAEPVPPMPEAEPDPPAAF